MIPNFRNHTCGLCGLWTRPAPRLLCTATKQKNNGQNLEEDVGHSEQKTDPPSPEKTLLEEKVKLEEQLKEATVRPAGPRGSASSVVRPRTTVGPYSKLLLKELARKPLVALVLP